MRFKNVDSQEADLASIKIVELVEGRHLPPEGRSGIAAEYEDHRTFGNKR
jgi:hypothetical protein